MKTAFGVWHVFGSESLEAACTPSRRHPKLLPREPQPASRRQAARAPNRVREHRRFIATRRGGPRARSGRPTVTASLLQALQLPEGVAGTPPRDARGTSRPAQLAVLAERAAQAVSAWVAPFAHRARTIIQPNAARAERRPWGPAPNSPRRPGGPRGAPRGCLSPYTYHTTSSGEESTFTSVLLKLGFPSENGSCWEADTAAGRRGPGESPKP